MTLGFIVLVLVTITAAMVVVTTRNIIHAAAFLGGAFTGVAGLYLLLDAPFIAGAQVLMNLSASDETIGKSAYRRMHLVAAQSARCLAGLIYVSSGPGESSSDLVFGGHALPPWTGPLRLIPPLRVAGAALATTLCTLLEVAILLVPLRSMSRSLGTGHVDHRWNRRDVVQALRIGLPVGLQMGAEVGIFALVALLAARVGTLQLAAHQVAISLASFTFTVALGVAAAGSVRVGIAIGKRDRLATRISGHVAFLGGVLVMGTSAAMFGIVPRTMAGLVTDQESVIRAAVPLLFGMKRESVSRKPAAVKPSAK